MNKDDILSMASLAGIVALGDVHIELEELERFAALVAEKEREACAKVCQYAQDCGPENGCCPTYWNEALDQAEAVIRARGNK